MSTIIKYSNSTTCCHYETRGVSEKYVTSSYLRLRSDHHTHYDKISIQQHPVDPISDTESTRCNRLGNVGVIVITETDNCGMSLFLISRYLYKRVCATAVQSMQTA